MCLLTPRANGKTEAESKIKLFHLAIKKEKSVYLTSAFYSPQF